MAKLNISISDWVLQEIIGDVRNRSNRIEELIIKGHMAEKDKEQ